MQPELQIFVDRACPVCAEARRLAKLAQQRLPGLKVELIDITDEGISLPKQVFAVPTYLLNGVRLWMGNPDEIDFLQRLKAAIQLH